MDIQIYINNEWVSQRFEILPSNTPTLDETLETFSFALISNDIAQPFAPMQKVRVYFSGNVIYTPFYIQHDSVETCSFNPIKYKHNVTCIQNTRELSKHLVRNSVFSQPAYLQKTAFNAYGCANGLYSQDGVADQYLTWIPNSTYNDRPEKLTLTNKEKIKNPYLRVSFQYFYGVVPSPGQAFAGECHCDYKAKTISDIQANLPYQRDLAYVHGFTLRYKDSNNVTRTEDVDLDDFDPQGFKLNTTYAFPRIKELADQGCNNFEALFDYSYFFTAIYKSDAEYYAAQRFQDLCYYQVQIEIVAEVYSYTCYDVLDLLIKRQRKQTSLRTLSDSFSLPQSGDLYNLLKNTPAPNFTFTQLTLYECVAEVFRVFDAIFTLDDDGVLGIEFFNDISKSTISSTKAKFTGRTLALSEDKYTNALVSYYQDARIKESFPADGSFAHLRSAEFGVPEAQDHNLIVPHNIDAIIKCELYITDFTIPTDTNGQQTVIDWFPLDITRFVVEQSIWSELDTGDVNSTDMANKTVKQANSVYFVRGDNKIQVASTFKTSWNITKYCLYQAAEMALMRFGAANLEGVVDAPDELKGQWDKVRMRLVYVSSVDGVEKVHSLTNKYEGETLIDQANGAVDLNKLGLNILGLALKLGNPTLNATHKISSWSNRIRTGEVYSYNGGLWIANVVNYTFLSDGRLQGKVSFVQNFNALSLRTQLLREKRLSNISKQLVQKSEEVITDYVYYCTSERSESCDAIHFNNDFLVSFLYSSFNIEGPYPYVGDAFTYYKDRFIPFTNNQFYLGIYIPMVKYGAGNTINFEMSFDHPMNAGNQTNSHSGWLNTSYFTNHVLYTDQYGFRDEFCIKAMQVGVNTNYDTNFPVVAIPSTTYPTTSARAGYFDILDYKAYKQPNEIFALNYQIAFLPFPGSENIDFLGNEWINHNCFVEKIEAQKRELKIVLFPSKNSVLDRKASGYAIDKPIEEVGWSQNSSNRIRLRFNIGNGGFTNSQINNNPYWAIIDSESNILFASNNPITYTNMVNIYFYSKLNRLS